MEWLRQPQAYGTATDQCDVSPDSKPSAKIRDTAAAIAARAR